MKHCIWCQKTEQDVPFKNLAHTIPQALGGRHICENVCDQCNSFFGNHWQGLPSVETIFKETFNISRAIFLESDQEVGKNKAMPKFKSTYFDVDLKKRKIDIKSSYKLHPGFQEKVGLQLRKGIYKVYLEEVERQFKDGHNTRYDFIRQFVRFGLVDYPVFYYKRRYGIILMVKSWAKQPELFLEENSQFKYLVKEPSFVEFEFLGHVFGIPTSRHWQIAFDNYKKKSFEAKKDLFESCILVKRFNDIDLALSILDSKQNR